MAEGTVAADQLRLFIERIERLEQEKKGIADDIKDVFAELKSNGYDVRATRAVLKLRKMETHTRQEAEALLETYKAALGLDGGFTPGSTSTSATVHQVDGADQYDRAVAIVTESQNASTSYLQRQLRIGYNEAAGYIERMERAALVSAPDYIGRRSVLVAA